MYMYNSNMHIIATFTISILLNDVSLSEIIRRRLPKVVTLCCVSLSSTCAVLVDLMGYRQTNLANASITVKR